MKRLLKHARVIDPASGVDGFRDVLIEEGKISAVGSGKVLEDGTLQPLDVKKGDRVLFSKYGGTEVTVEGEEHLIIREDDILGIIE